MTKRMTMRIVGLALWCLLAAASAFAQNAGNDPPDTIFYNGRIITVDSGFSIQQAFAIKGDVYVAVGANASIRGLAGRNTRLVDLQGSAVIPGLSDNHDHLYNSEKVMRGIDLVVVWKRTASSEALFASALVPRSPNDFACAKRDDGMTSLNPSNKKAKVRE